MLLKIQFNFVIYFNGNPATVLIPNSWGIGENNQNAAARITYLGTHFALLFDWSENSHGKQRKEEMPVDKSHWSWPWSSYIALFVSATLGELYATYIQNAQHSWIWQLVWSQNAQFRHQLVLLKVGSCSQYKQTAPEFVWKQTKATSSRRYHYTRLICFWCSPEYKYHIHTCPNEPYREGTLVRSNQTKWGRCKIPLRNPNKYFLLPLISVQLIRINRFP